MTFVIERMLDEIDGAEEYYKAACFLTQDDPTAKRVYKETALGELSNFDKLAILYQNKVAREMPEKTTDVWLKYFKQKAETLKQKINEI